MRLIYGQEQTKTHHCRLLTREMTQVQKATADERLFQISRDHFWAKKTLRKGPDSWKQGSEPKLCLIFDQMKPCRPRCILTKETQTEISSIFGLCSSLYAFWVCRMRCSSSVVQLKNLAVICHRPWGTVTPKKLSGAPNCGVKVNQTIDRPELDHNLGAQGQGAIPLGCCWLSSIQSFPENGRVWISFPGFLMHPT